MYFMISQNLFPPPGSPFGRCPRSLVLKNESLGENDAIPSSGVGTLIRLANEPHPSSQPRLVWRWAHDPV